jgi:hypothetical protein
MRVARFKRIRNKGLILDNGKKAIGLSPSSVREFKRGEPNNHELGFAGQQNWVGLQ